MPETILEYQYDNLVKQLSLLELHSLDPNCPCRMGGEHCELKHLRNIQGLAEETANIEKDKSKAEKLKKLAHEAGFGMEEEKKKLCGKPHDEIDLAGWSKSWRKQFEAPICHVEPKPAGSHLGGNPEGRKAMHLSDPPRLRDYLERLKGITATAAEKIKGVLKELTTAEKTELTEVLAGLPKGCQVTAMERRGRIRPKMVLTVECRDGQKYERTIEGGKMAHLGNPTTATNPRLTKAEFQKYWDQAMSNPFKLVTAPETGLTLVSNGFDVYYIFSYRPPTMQAITRDMEPYGPDLLIENFDKSPREWWVKSKEY